MKIALGSTSQTKLTYLQRTLKKFEIKAEIVPTNVDSKIADQPLSENETIEGAKNRARNAILNSNKVVNIGIGMEGGLTKIGSDYFLVCAVAIYGNNNYYLGVSSKLPLPREITKKINNGEQFGVVIRKLAEKTRSRWDKELLSELVSRKKLFAQALNNALLSYKNKKLIGVQG